MFARSIAAINLFLSPLEKQILPNRKWISYIILGIAYLSLGGLFFVEMQKDFGGYAFIVLLVILILSPLSRVSGITLLSKLMPFRKELGILMGMLVIVHYGLFLR